jgi:hypothetical protein
MEPGGTKSEFINHGMGWLSPHPAYQEADAPNRVIEAWLKSPEAQATFVPAEDVAETMYKTVSQGKQIPTRVPTDHFSWKTIKEEVNRIDRDLDNVKELDLWDKNEDITIPT